MNQLQQKQIDRVYQAAFDHPRDPRSDAYKCGVRDGIASRLKVAPAKCPYRLGTAEADAWFSGVDEGRAIARQGDSESR